MRRVSPARLTPHDTAGWGAGVTICDNHEEPTAPSRRALQRQHWPAQLPAALRQMSSATTAIAPHGHSAAHMPQPLQ